MTSTQQRVVIAKAVLPQALELVDTLKLPDLSNLISILITRYGKHLRDTWVLPVQPHVAYSPAPIPVQHVPQQQQHFQPVMMQQSTAVQVSNNSQIPIQQQPQPQSQMVYEQSQNSDPVIERMAGLLEEF